MAAESALNALETTAIDRTVLMAYAAITTEAIGPTGFLQGRLTFLLRPVEPQALRQADSILELDHTVGHSLPDIRAPVRDSTPPCAERAE